MLRVLMILAALVAFFCVGCTGEQLARGGGLHFQSDGKGGVMLKGSGDISVAEATYKGPTGEAVSIKGYSRNSSNLGAIQGAASVEALKIQGQTLQTVVGMLVPLVDRFVGGGGSVVVPSAPAVDLTAAENTRTAILAKLDACPFIPAEKKPAIAAWVKAYPAAKIGDLAGFAAGL
jgi:hypothetical protein